MNGIEATRAIRKLNQTIPIIAQTAMVNQEDMNKCLDAGCNSTIIKPIEVEELLLKVNHYFAN
jgi:CheY-like chemotaxis protein